MSIFDNWIADFDSVLRTVAGVSAGARPSPGNDAPECKLEEAQRRRSAGLMRVNHVGEVCAQALYDAQGKLSRSVLLRTHFAEAAREEQDHLAWTAQRLDELGSRPSLLNPFWYAGAYLIGSTAARLGDARSLGFVVETERQVEAHLEEHLRRLPPEDHKSRAVVDQMRRDEAAHGDAAQALGAQALPMPLRAAMRAMAKVMTATAYYI